MTKTLRSLFSIVVTIFFASLQPISAQDVNVSDIKIDGEGNIVVGNNIRIGITTQTVQNLLADRDAKILELKDIIANRRFILAGRWSNNEGLDGFGGSLVIDREAQKSFHFSLSSAFGAHTCSISGTATLVNTYNATFSGEEDCRISFHIDQTRESISVAKESQLCSHYCGIQGRFEGTYSRDDDTLAARILFPINVSVFSQLVGDDYGAFQTRMRRIHQENIEDLDGLRATISTGSAAGFADSPAIIMQREDGAIWAAYLEWSGKQVKYWSNVSGWKDNVPDTIREWIASNSSVSETALHFLEARGSHSSLSPIFGQTNVSAHYSGGRYWLSALPRGKPSWCSRAGTEVEKTVCRFKVLSEKDYQLNQAYSERKNTLNSQAFGVIRSKIEVLMNERDRCGPVPGCIAGVYRRALQVLNQS